MKHEKLIQQYKKLMDFGDKRKEKINGELQKLKESKVLELPTHEITNDLNYIAKCLFEKKHAEKTFILGKSTCRNGTKLFVEGNKLFYREYQRKRKNDVDLLCSWENYDWLYNELPDSFSKMVNEITEETNRYKEEMEEKYTEKNLYNRGRSSKEVEVFTKPVNFRTYTSDQYSSDEIKINHIKEIHGNCKKDHQNLIYNLHAFDEHSNTLSVLSRTFLIIDAAHREALYSIKKFKMYDKKLRNALQRKKNKIIKLYEKYGYDKYLVMRGI